MSACVSARQAQQALAAIREQFRGYVQPEDPALPPLCPEPTLIEGAPGRYAVTWDRGPDAWALRAVIPHPADDGHTLALDACREIGVGITPITPFAIGIHPLRSIPA